MARQFLKAFLIWMAFAFWGLYSITMTVNWWKGELQAGPWEWLWIGLLPVWLFAFFRYYSIFQPGCSACPLPEEESDKPLG